MMETIKTMDKDQKENEENEEKEEWNRDPGTNRDGGEGGTQDQGPPPRPTRKLG